MSDFRSSRPLLSASLSGLVERVSHLVEVQAPDVETLSSSPASDAFSSLDRTSVVSVLGAAGSGKSTVLQLATERLAREDGRLVIPITSPERFAPGDTLFGWTLAALQMTLVDRRHDLLNAELELDGVARSVREQLDLLRRQEALSRVNVRETQSSASLTSPDTLAINLIAVTTAGLELVRGWWALLACATGGDTGIRQIVVPVDDADQNPEALSELLREVRWMTAHPAVTVLLGANEDVMLGRLGADQAFTSGGASSATAALVKALPRHLRTEMRLLPLEARERFVPLGEDQSLRDLLDAIAMPEPAPVGIRTLNDYFEIDTGEQRLVTGYAHMLPGNPRRLRQLWHALDNIISDPRAHKAGRAVKTLLEEAVASARVDDRRVPANVVQCEEHDDGEVVGEAVFTEIVAGARAGRGVSIYEHDERYISARFNDGFYTAPREAAGSDEGRDARSPFPPALSYALQFMLDVAPRGLLPTPVMQFTGQVGRLMNPGASNWRWSIRLQIRGDETPNESFLPVPNWDNFIDYLLYIKAWNSMMTLLAALDDDEPSRSDDTTITFIVWFHLVLVTEIQESRTVSSLLPLDGSEALRTLIAHAATEAAWRDVTARAKALIDADGQNVRDGDYQLWVRRLLVVSADTTFVPSGLGERVLALRDTALSDIPLADRRDADDSAASFIGARIERNLDSRWVAATLDLLGRFDPRRASRLRQAHELAISRPRQDQVIANALQSRGVPEAVVGQLVLEGMNEDIARTLASLGFARQAIAQVAAQFPPAEVREFASKPFPTESPGDDDPGS